MTALAELRLARGELLIGVSGHQVLSNLGPKLAAGSAASVRLAAALRNGSSALACIDAQIALERERVQLARTLERQFAGTKATVQLILWLPLASAVGSQLIGLAVLTFLLFNPLGWVVTLIGIGLNLLGWRWIRRLLGAVNTNPAFAAALEYDLLADSLEAGLAVPTALGQVLAERELSSELSGLLNHQRSRGYPLVPLLRESAEAARQSERDQLTLALEVLPTRLLLPIGATLLPAFLLLNVIPAAAAALTAYR